MSQKSVEQILGLMLTDAALLHRFATSRSAVLAELVEAGLDLTTVEREALLKLDPAVCKRFVEQLDRRLRKVQPNDFVP